MTAIGRMADEFAALRGTDRTAASEVLEQEARDVCAQQLAEAVS